MKKTDPYKILGVHREATDDEIKKAYRRLARQHHPDLNNNSGVSEQRFKEVSEAYEILSDSGKRRRYDRFGHADSSWNPVGGASGTSWGGYTGSSYRSGRGYHFGRSAGEGFFEDFFSEFVRSQAHGGKRSYRSAKARDYEYSLTVDFEQAFRGVHAFVRIKDRKIDVHIPAGVETGSRVRVPGQGEFAGAGVAPGDLYLEITVRPHEFFRREGKNIYFTVGITVAEAILGARVEIPGPDGRLALKLPPGTQSGTVFRFKEKGFPSLSDPTRGDFLVTSNIVVPEDVDDVSRSILEEFERRNPIRPRRGL